jgi:hypothetical protein
VIVTQGDGEPQASLTQAEMDVLLKTSNERFQYLSAARFFSGTSFVGILEGVRAKILDWVLALEKKGVLGEGMTFNENVQRRAAPRRAAPASSIVNNHHYNNSGIANVMGPDGVASGNTNNVQITQQTLNLTDPRIADELAAMRKVLAAETEDDDAAIEAGTIASAQKALKAGDEGGFRAAMKRLGAKAWGVAERLALSWMTAEGRHLLGPPLG